MPDKGYSQFLVAKQQYREFVEVNTNPLVSRETLEAQIRAMRVEMCRHVAAVLVDCRPNRDKRGWFHWNTICLEMAKELKRADPSFDESQFITACRAVVQ